MHEKHISTPVARALLVSAVLFAGFTSTSPAQHRVDQAGRFMDCKTFFQTNLGYDPRIAIATDAVVVHRHGDATDSLRKAIGSWKDKGFVVGRMFFADSDATNVYWKGKWDGTPHEDEVERDANGNVVLCSGIRPYMLPTEGWIRHLEEMTRQSIEAGADAVLPEEPLAHSFTGYEEAFKPLFEKRFGIPWQPQAASAEAHFLTCQLKTELYLELERRLARVTMEEAARIGRPIDFLMPVHALYSNRASRLVAPMGMALGMEGLDGYVGQVWTGPINWSLANYSSPDKSFFASAYLLYDYFAALVAGREEKMWMLTDPVEDDPNHKWSEFEEWYRHSLVAKLMFSEIDTYEVMPWPDRIFLPGYQTGGGTPAPEDYRISLLSALQVLQEVPARQTDKSNWAAGFKIGVAVADSLLWEPHGPAVLDGVFGLLMPPLNRGVRISVSLAERWPEPNYLDRFRVLVVSYENFKPLDPQQNVSLAEWVRRGGTLILLGGAGELQGEQFWWNRLQQPSALHHLCSLLGASGEAGNHQIGKGWVLRREESPRRFANPEAADQYLVLLADAVNRAEPGSILKNLDLMVKRGPFEVVHARRGAKLALPGPFEWTVVDVLDPDLPVLQDVRMKAGESGIFRRVDLTGATPAVLHCTHRLMEQTHTSQASRVVIRGPAETPAVVRLFTAGREVESRKVTAGDQPVPAEFFDDEGTRSVLIRFPNVPGGAVIEIAWQQGE